jgi:hypothetical protein
MSDLDYTLEISTPLGWLLLEDEANGYSLGAGTKSEVSTSRRDRTTEGQWVEGTFTLASVKGNEEVPVEVYVEADTPAVLDQRLQVLKDAFDQLTYQIRETWEGMERVWYCMPGPYSISASTALMVAKEALFKATVPRLPTTTVTYTP